MNNSYSYITGTTTTIPSVTACVLSGITVNTPVSTGVITVYNGATAATGSIIAIITSTATLTPYSVPFYDICLNEGLTIVTSAAAQNITVAFRGA